VLSKLAYLTLRRSIQLLVLLARGDTGTAALPPVVLLRQTRHAAALAPAPGRGRLDLPASRTGRPPLDQERQQLIVRLARENPRWSYQRIRGELLRLGLPVSATAIRTTLPLPRLRRPAGAGDDRGALAHPAGVPRQHQRRAERGRPGLLRRGHAPGQEDDRVRRRGP
jgi:hypothetical protein